MIIMLLLKRGSQHAHVARVRRSQSVSLFEGGGANNLACTHASIGGGASAGSWTRVTGVPVSPDPALRRENVLSTI